MEGRGKWISEFEADLVYKEKKSLLYIKSSRGIKVHDGRVEAWLLKLETESLHLEPHAGGSLFFNIIFILCVFFTCMYVVYHAQQYPQRPEEDIGFPLELELETVANCR